MTLESDTVTAALLIIGDEILSGRTQDKNTSYIATWLNEIGVELSEVRVVPDDKARIVDGVNSLRTSYDYLFTTGGIGPTHDDITADCIAAAFDVPLLTHPVATNLLEKHYGADEFTDARRRMARIPDGGVLIDNPVSIAPGFQVENVFVMAGVPKIMQAMLEGLRDRIKGGRSVLSRTLTVYAPESRLADILGEKQGAHDDISIGSYPFFREGIIGTEVVIRSKDAQILNSIYEIISLYCEKQKYEIEEKL